MLNAYEAAENLSGIADPTGITIFNPAEPTRDCDECNCSHEASNLVPFPWKERFKSALDARDLEYDIGFSVCSECNEFLKGVRKYDITAQVDDPERSVSETPARGSRFPASGSCSPEADGEFSTGRRARGASRDAALADSGPAQCRRGYRPYGPRRARKTTPGDPRNAAKPRRYWLVPEIPPAPQAA